MSKPPLDMSGKVVHLRPKRKSVFPDATVDTPPPPPDIPALLERVAAMIRAGEVEADNLLVILSSDDGYDNRVFYVQPAGDRHKLIGMASDAAISLTTEEML